MARTTRAQFPAGHFILIHIWRSFGALPVSHEMGIVSVLFQWG